MKLIHGFYMTSKGVDNIDFQVDDFTSWLEEDNSNAELVETLIVGNGAVVNVCHFIIMIDCRIRCRRVCCRTKSCLLNQLSDNTGSVTTSEPASSFMDNPFLYASSTLDIVGITAYSDF